MKSSSSFDPQALELYAEMMAEKKGVDFSEGETYDFTRCVRPDGSSYGTGGKCRQGSEQAKGPEDKKAKSSKPHKADGGGASKFLDSEHKKWNKHFMDFENGKRDDSPQDAGRHLAEAMNKKFNLKLDAKAQERLASRLEDANNNYFEDGGKGPFSKYVKDALKGI